MLMKLSEGGRVLDQDHLAMLEHYYPYEVVQGWTLAVF